MEVGEEPNPLRSSEETTPAMHEERPHLLHRCASSLVCIAHKAYRRIEELDGCIGLLARIVAFMARPFVRAVERKWLSWLSFLDAIILTVEVILMYFIPSLEPIFTKIDELAPFADSLPEKFDDAVDDLPELVHQLSLVQLSSALKRLANTIMDWSLSNEKEIRVDVKHDKQPERDEEEEGKQQGEATHEHELSPKDEKVIKEVEKSCKEILGALEKMEVVEKGDGVGEEGEGKVEAEVKGATGGGGSEPQKDSSEVMMSDPFIELFDEGWHTK